jgi:Na+/H+ antiporter NhaC
VAIPLVVPVAQALGCNVWVALGAVISAGSFGAHACFYSDATLLASAGAGCDNVQHALTQLPYALISAAVSALVFLAIGFM